MTVHRTSLHFRGPGADDLFIIFVSAGAVNPVKDQGFAVHMKGVRCNGKMVSLGEFAVEALKRFAFMCQEHLRLFNWRREGDLGQGCSSRSFERCWEGGL